MQGTTETTERSDRWRRYCELKAESMEQEARHYYWEAEAAEQHPHVSDEERKENVAHYLKLAKSYRYEHAEFWRKQAAEAVQ
jgi:hypothetical protein